MFPKKYASKLPETFAGTADSMSEEELKKKMVECSGNIYNIEKALEEDEKLVQAKEMVKEMAAPYKDAAAAENAKIKYCLYVLEGRGKEIGNKEVD